MKLTPGCYFNIKLAFKNVTMKREKKIGPAFLHKQRSFTLGTTKFWTLLIGGR